MCYSTPTASQEEAGSISDQISEEEAARQEAIAAGNAAIDEAFGQFDDTWYSGLEDSYLAYYQPQLDAQFTDANGLMEAGLARKGTDRSSIAASQLGDLFSTYADQSALLGNQAVDASNKAKAEVDSQKSSLYSLNAASADPQQASTEALAAATALSAQPTYSPLGNVFASFLAPYTAYYTAAANSAGSGYP